MPLPMLLIVMLKRLVSRGAMMEAQKRSQLMNVMPARLCQMRLAYRPSLILLPSVFTSTLALQHKIPIPVILLILQCPQSGKKSLAGPVMYR